MYGHKEDISLIYYFAKICLHLHKIATPIMIGGIRVIERYYTIMIHETEIEMCMSISCIFWYHIKFELIFLCQWIDKNQIG